MNAPTTHSTEASDKALSRTIGLHGRVAVFSAMAGGVASGGVLVAALTLTGRLSGHALFLSATALFVVGALLGLIHGAVLGYFGRPVETAPSTALRQLILAGLYAVPGLAVAWLVSIWVAMTLIAYYTGKIGALVGVGLGWVAAAAILATAAIQILRAFRNALARWPERRAGTLLVGATFAALLVTFLADRPELWGLRLRVTETGAVLLAIFLTLWVAGPIITMALRLARQLPTAWRSSGSSAGTWTLTDLVIGLVIGAVVGLLAVPFTAPVAPSVTSAFAGNVIVGVGQALVNEVLLRLFMISALAWLLLRWHRVHPDEAAVGSVAAVTLLQVGLYLPGALAVGFPSWTGTVAFLAIAVALPAAAFGVLFWKRGFATALVADVTALVAIALLVP